MIMIIKYNVLQKMFTFRGVRAEKAGDRFYDLDDKLFDM